MFLFTLFYLFSFNIKYIHISLKITIHRTNEEWSSRYISYKNLTRLTNQTFGILDTQSEDVDQARRSSWRRPRCAASVSSLGRFSCSSRSCWSWKHRLRSAATYTASTPIFCGCSSTADFRPRPTTCFWATTLIGGSSPWRRYVCCWRTRSSIRKISSCCAAITSAPA